MPAEDILKQTCSESELREALEYWSSNDFLFQKEEGEDEVLVRWARNLLRGETKDRRAFELLLQGDIEASMPTTEVDLELRATKQAIKGKATGYSTYINCPDTMSLLTKLIRLPLHFRPTQCFKLFFLNKIHGRFSGVSGRYSV